MARPQPDPYAEIGPQSTRRSVRRQTATETVTDFWVRCPGLLPGRRLCGALLGERLTRPWTLSCRRCKHTISLEVGDPLLMGGAAPQTPPRPHEGPSPS